MPLQHSTMIADTVISFVGDKVVVKFNNVVIAKFPLTEFSDAINQALLDYEGDDPCILRRANETSRIKLIAMRTEDKHD